jgi:hypothetical protein
MSFDTSLKYKIKGAQSRLCLYSNSDGRDGHHHCENHDDQKFNFVSVDGGYKIKGVQSNKCLYSNSDGRYGHYNCENHDDQKWTFESVGDTYKIKGVQSNKCLYSNSDWRYGHYNCENYDDQKFYIVPTEYKCCMANVERKDANTTTDYDLQCGSEESNPASTVCTNIYSEYCKVGDRMINDSKCKALEGSNYTLYSTLMKEKCNLDDFYQSTTCINWCKNNSTQCDKLNTSQSCKEFGIPASECTPKKVLDVKTECQQYGIRSEQGLAITQCSLDSINSLKAQCEEYGILDSCSPTALQDAIDNATQIAQLELQAQTQEQIQKNYDTTQKTIAELLDLTPPESKPEAPDEAPDEAENIFDIEKIKEWIKERYIIVIIIVVIIFLIISSSSSLLVLVSSKK